MHTLQSKKDGFRLLLPDDFLVDEIKEKYSIILQKNKHFVYRPIDFLNETIQKVEVFGFNNDEAKELFGKMMLIANGIGISIIEKKITCYSKG